MKGKKLYTRKQKSGWNSGNERTQFRAGSFEEFGGLEEEDREGKFKERAGKSTVEYGGLVRDGRPFGGGTRFEMLDQDTPGSWVVDPAGHRAIYSGRIMEDRIDRMPSLTHGVWRHYTISFNLPPGVHCGPGLGVPPPPSPSDDEYPSEEVPVGGTSSGTSSPTVAAAIDLGSGAEPARPAVETDAVIDIVVLDLDSDDDLGDA
ncbi:uncharacterized protein LOC130727753 [Lotus japonicus]|uniref:uncharacterized protein LOC130727753 n=1 Tax=Lotus japonicus TaxID=34305 RepID=UPI00258C9CBE|nr:uncharacterized protein LOC130727753 [Lotus japonicus]XP_057435081.1 uncharacterized protein LOC130727753 [Lotus japonicus]